MTDKPRLINGQDQARILAQLLEKGPIEFDEVDSPSGLIPIVEPTGTPGRSRARLVSLDEVSPALGDEIMEQIVSAVVRGGRSSGKSNAMDQVMAAMEAMDEIDHTGHGCDLDPTRDQRRREAGRVRFLSEAEVAERALRGAEIRSRGGRREGFEPKVVGGDKVTPWVPPALG